MHKPIVKQNKLFRYQIRIVCSSSRILLVFNDHSGIINMGYLSKRAECDDDISGESVVYTLLVWAHQAHNGTGMATAGCLRK